MLRTIKPKRWGNDMTQITKLKCVVLLLLRNSKAKKSVFRFTLASHVFLVFTNRNRINSTQLASEPRVKNNRVSRLLLFVEG